MTKEEIIEMIYDNIHILNEYKFKKIFPKEYIQLSEYIFPEKLRFVQKIYHYLHDDMDLKLGVCPECGKRCNFINFKKGYYVHCSIKCSSNSERTKSKRETTMIDRYGVPNAMQCHEIQQKAEETCFKNNGVRHPLQKKEFLDKAMRTNQTNLGVDWPGQSPVVKEKTRLHNQEKFGADWFPQTKEYKVKTRQTDLEKYGYESHNQSLIVKENKRKACQNKYGKDNVFQVDWVQENIRKTNIEKRGVDNPSKAQEVKDKISNKNKGHHFCTNIYFSKAEKEILQYIKDIYSGQIIENDRNIMKLEIDILLPELKLGFEYNGDLWHMNPVRYSENDMNPINRQIAKDIWKRDEDKIKLAESKGIRIITIWEYDWKNKKDEIKQYIHDIINNLTI